MSRTISFKTTFALASVSVFAALAPALAQEQGAAEEKPAATEESAETAPAKAGKVFFPLMRCKRAEGKVMVLKPRTTEWVDAVEGRYYPFGSTVRVAADGSIKPDVVFEFGEKSAVVISSDAEFATREIEIGATARIIELLKGRIELKFPRTLGEGLLKVVAPAFCCENLAGESIFDYSNVKDGDEAMIRCVTGTIALKGSHYSIPRMGAANQIRVRTTGDQLFTSIRGESGDCKVLLDQGIGTEKDFETGETKEVPKTLEFSLSPQCSIKVFRAKSAVGGRVVVSTMTFDSTGRIVNRCAFAEGLSNVNSGELVVPEKLPEVDKNQKKVDDEDDAESIDAKPAKDDEGAEGDDKKDEKKEEDI